MFTTIDTEHLRHQIDRFNVPMFIAQFAAASDSFELLAINRLHELETGMKMADVINKPLTELLPPSQAAAVAEKYEKCMREKATQRYREVLDLPRGSMIWDTTLQYAAIHGQPDRIIGSAVVLEQIEHDDHDVLAFEDVRYLASATGCELGKVAALFEAVEAGHIGQEQLIGSVGMLAGLCRSIDYKLNEIRTLSEQRVKNRQSRALRRARLHLIETGPEQAQRGNEVDAALAALVNLIGTLPDTGGKTHDPVSLRVVGANS